MIRKLIFHASGILVVAMLLVLLRGWQAVSEYNKASQNFWNGHRPSALGTRPKTPVFGDAHRDRQLRAKHILGRARPTVDARLVRPCVTKSLPALPVRVDFNGRLQVLCGFRQPYIVDWQHK